MLNLQFVILFKIQTEKHEGICATDTFTELNQMDQSVGSLMSYDLTILVAVVKKSSEKITLNSTILLITVKWFETSSASQMME